LGAISLVVTGVGAAAAALMVAGEFATVASVELTGVDEGCEVQLLDPELRDRCELNGFDRHGGALLLIAALTLALAVAAGIGASGAAAAGLAAVGALVLGIALLVDLPVTDDTGAIGPRFEGARASTGPGLWLELVAGALALGAGALRLAAERRALRLAADARYQR
jgi:hypothetical protein